ncbi:MAG: hypothetical protein EXS01_07050 [Phycisphaerales bacterium]|nr:hypothetical protein [Phycisphaerales bacterium]
MSTAHKTAPASPQSNRPPHRIDWIDFSAVLPFIKIFGAAHSGLRPARIALAFALLLTVVASGRLWDGFAQPSSPAEGLLAGPLRERQLVEDLEAVRSVVVADLREDQRAAARTASLDELNTLLISAAHDWSAASRESTRYSKLAEMIDAARPRSSFEALYESVRGSFYRAVRGVLHGDFPAVVSALRVGALDIPIASWNAAPCFTLYFTLVCIVVFGWGGGVLCRLSAGDLSDRAWSVGQARAFIRPRVSSLIYAPLFALTLGLVFFIPAWLMGVLVNIPLLDVVGGLLFGAALVTSALCALVLTVLAIGLPLFAPAVACDGCDAVESVQRAGAYICARPLHLLWFAFVSLIVIALGTLVADYAATAAWTIAMTAYDSASGARALVAVGSLQFLEPFQPATPALLGLTESTTAALIDVWRTIPCLLIGACALSIAFSCATRSYLLVRSVTDGQDPCDLWEDSAAA